MTSPTEPGPASAEDTPPRTGLVLRNTLWLVLAQILGTPLSVVVNAVMARRLGPEEFGYFYLAQTMAAFGFLAVDAGQGGALPALVVKDRSRAGQLLGSGFAWRAVAALVVYALLSGASFALGYEREFHVALSLVVLTSAVGSFTGGSLDVILGFERTDVRATAQVGQQLLMAALVIPTLLLGGGLRDALLAQTVAYLLVAVYVWRALGKVGVGPLSFRGDTLRALLVQGSPFLLLGVISNLQPNVDALLLSKLAATEAMGWHAAAKKVTGVLVFPAAAMISALYPTLVRLHGESADAFAGAVRGALRTAAILVTPAAVGCAFYAEIGISIFSRHSFAQAEDNLRIMSVFVLLLYFSMTLSIALSAAGLQKRWAFAQLGCVAISVAADPVLIPWFERRAGNGGLGVAVSSVLSELLMVAVGLYMAPRGIVNAALLKRVGIVFAAGAAMAGVAHGLGRAGVNVYASAVIATAAYGAALLGLGGIDEEQRAALRGILKRRPAR